MCPPAKLVGDRISTIWTFPLRRGWRVLGRIGRKMRQVVEQGRAFPVEFSHHGKIRRLIELLVHLALDELFLREGEQIVCRLLEPDACVLPIADIPAADRTGAVGGTDDHAVREREKLLVQARVQHL